MQKIKRNLTSFNFFFIDDEGLLIPASFTIDSIVESSEDLIQIINAVSSFENKIFLVKGFSKFEKTKSKQKNFFIKTNTFTLDYPITKFVNIEVPSFTLENLSIEIERLINEKTGLTSGIKIHENVLTAGQVTSNFRTIFIGESELTAYCGTIDLFGNITSQEQFNLINNLAITITNSLNTTFTNAEVPYFTTIGSVVTTDISLTPEGLFTKLLDGYKVKLQELGITTTIITISSSEGLIQRF